MNNVESVVIAIMSAIVYAATMYIKKRMKDDPEQFDIVKFVTTIIAGAVIGTLMVLSDIPITEQNVEEQFMIYAGLVAIIENIVKVLYRKITG